MNELKMYSIYDVKAEVYGAPHFLKSNGVAIRSFSQACEDENTDFNKYPEDFSLYYIGTFNIENGDLTPSKPKQIANASEFVVKKTQESRVSHNEISKFATQQLHEIEGGKVN